MGIFRQFPYTNFHDLNLDWVLAKIKELWQGVIDLDEKMDDFFVEIEPTIRDEVEQWLDEHPEATTTVEDGSLTLPKFSDELKEDVVLNNEAQIHKVIPVFINDEIYVPDGEQANGFSADDNYFYIAHSGDDNDYVKITRVNRSTGAKNTYLTNVTGHASTMCVYNGLIYLADGTNNKVDIFRTANPTSVINTINWDSGHNINGFIIKDIKNYPTIVATHLKRTGCDIGRVINNHFQLQNVLTFKDNFRDFIQGSDIDIDSIWMSRSFGEYIRPNTYAPTITQYSYDGRPVSIAYIMLEYIDSTKDLELEDIYLDNINKLIYYVTARGRIGFMDISDFQIVQTNHQIGADTFKRTEYFPVVHYANGDLNVTYKSDCLIADSIIMNQYSSKYQGMYSGNGLVAGMNAVYTARGGEIFGQAMNPYPGTDSSGSKIICAIAKYVMNDNGTITFDAGRLYVRKPDGTVEDRNLYNWSLENTRARTTINQMAFHTNSRLYNSVAPEIITQG